MISNKEKLKLLINSIENDYFSKSYLRKIMNERNINIADLTLSSYIKDFKKSKLLYSAGRGWYTKIEKKGTLNNEPVRNLVDQLIKEFPFLEFSCWSTEQFQPFFHHLLGKHLTFVYTARDALSTIAAYLGDSGYSVLEKPSSKIYKESLQKRNIDIIVRPSIEREPYNNSHYSPIEKASIDFISENNAGDFCSAIELQQAINNIAKSFYIDIPLLEEYANRKLIKLTLLLDNPTM